MTSGPDAASGVDDLDDGTLFVRRGGVPTEPLGEDDLDEATRRAPRSAVGSGIRHPVPDIDAETGSTMVVRRETRRRAEAAAREAEPDLDVTIVGAGVRPLPATVAGDVPAALGRRAHAPHPADAVYEARSVRPPVIATGRAPRPVHTPQLPFDGAATELVVRRRARRRAFIVVAAVSIVLIVAVATVIVLAFAG